MPPRSSVVLSPPEPLYPQVARVPSTTAHADSASRVISPIPIYPQSSLLSESRQQSLEVSQQRSPPHVKVESRGQESSHGSFSVLQPVSGSSQWAVDSLGIHTPSMQSDSYYTNFAQHIRGLRTGEAAIELPPNAPHQRHVFTPIAPQPIETSRSMAAKRSRDDDEAVDMSKRRRRSESTTSTQLELTEEDKLLLKLKEEESMPWKDIAARFQNDLGKQYQIPALQMRLKRLRERMRTWSEADVRALRMAHEYWAQNKFDIVSQKVRLRCMQMHDVDLTVPDGRIWCVGEVDGETVRTQVGRDGLDAHAHVGAAVRSACPTHVHAVLDEPCRTCDVVSAVHALIAV
jgi:hypothetical protein